jgi:4-hydroxy-tetrahydrodipicolinate synthase
MKLEGTFVALVTPFKNGQLNEQKIRELVRFQIQNGSDGLVPCGTTGESPTLSEEEKFRIFEIVIEEAKGKATVVAGTGTNDTAKSIKATKRAKEMGADAALVITPYYNKPTQEGLCRHFEAIAKAVDLPIMIYNVPGRTSVNMLPATVARLANIDTIVAIKEASGDLNQVSEIIAACGDQIKVFSGDDSLFLPILSVGGVGVVSVVANIVPKDLKALFTAFKAGDLSKAQKLHRQLFPLCQAMFYETNPAPVKTAMNLLRQEVGELRLPLAPMSDANQTRLEQALKNYGLLA